MEKRLARRFQATGASGREYTVEMWTEYASLANHRGDSGEVAVLSELQTTDGLQLFRLARGQYQVVRTGEVLRSTDPNAP